jgi:hypothetical protein
MVHEYLNRMEASKRLRIFDSADVVDAKSGGEPTPWIGSLTRSLSPSELRSVVFTATNSNVFKILIQQRVIESGVISQESGQEAVQRYLSNRIQPQEREQVKWGTLCESLARIIYH